MNEKSVAAVREELTAHGTGETAAGSALAVMYHYIREHYTGSGIFGMTVAQFEAQILWLKEHYEVLHPLAFLEWVKERGSLPSRGCVLTFDDGLADHYRYVFPILQKHGLAAFFFLTTAPLETGRIATIHKVHLLRQAMGEERFAAEFRRRLATSGWVSEQTDCHVEGQAAYRWDIPEVNGVKFLISRTVPYPLLDSVVTEIFKEVLGTDKEHRGAVYLSWDEGKELLKAGMVIGGHSHAHRMYSRLEPAEQEADITACLSALERRLGLTVTAYAYPFGQASTFTAVSKNLLQLKSIVCAFANETGAIGSDADLLALKRVDPKDPMLHHFSNG